MTTDDAQNDDGLEAQHELEKGDYLKGAEEHDGTNDAFRRASDELQDGLGLTEADRKPVPADDDAAGDAMP